jgi:hypothetical protein
VKACSGPFLVTWLECGAAKREVPIEDQSGKQNFSAQNHFHQPFPDSLFFNIIRSTIEAGVESWIVFVNHDRHHFAPIADHDRKHFFQAIDLFSN